MVSNCGLCLSSLCQSAKDEEAFQRSRAEVSDMMGHDRPHRSQAQAKAAVEAQKRFASPSVKAAVPTPQAAAASATVSTPTPSGAPAVEQPQPPNPSQPRGTVSDTALRRVKTESFLTITPKEYMERRERERRERERIEEERKRLKMAHQHQEAAAVPDPSQLPAPQTQPPHPSHKDRHHTNIFDQMQAEHGSGRAPTGSESDKSKSNRDRDRHSLERSNVEQSYKDKYRERSSKERIGKEPPTKKSKDSVDSGMVLTKERGQVQGSHPSRDRASADALTHERHAVPEQHHSHPHHRHDQRSDVEGSHARTHEHHHRREREASDRAAHRADRHSHGSSKQGVSASSTGNSGQSIHTSVPGTSIGGEPRATVTSADSVRKESAMASAHSSGRLEKTRLALRSEAGPAEDGEYDAEEGEIVDDDSPAVNRSASQSHSSHRHKHHKERRSSGHHRHHQASGSSTGHSSSDRETRYKSPAQAALPEVAPKHRSPRDRHQREQNQQNCDIPEQALAAKFQIGSSPVKPSLKLEISTTPQRGRNVSISEETLSSPEMQPVVVIKRMDSSSSEPPTTPLKKEPPLSGVAGFAHEDDGSSSRRSLSHGASRKTNSQQELSIAPLMGSQDSLPGVPGKEHHRRSESFPSKESLKMKLGVIPPFSGALTGEESRSQQSRSGEQKGRHHHHSHGDKKDRHHHRHHKERKEKSRQHHGSGEGKPEIKLKIKGLGPPPASVVEDPGRDGRSRLAGKEAAERESHGIQKLKIKGIDAEQSSSHSRQKSSASLEMSVKESRSPIIMGRATPEGEGMGTPDRKELKLKLKLPPNPGVGNGSAPTGDGVPRSQSPNPVKLVLSKDRLSGKYSTGATSSQPSDRHSNSLSAVQGVASSHRKRRPHSPLDPSTRPHHTKLPRNDSSSSLSGSHRPGLEVFSPTGTSSPAPIPPGLVSQIGALIDIRKKNIYQTQGSQPGTPKSALDLPPLPPDDQPTPPPPPPLETPPLPPAHTRTGS